MRLSDRAVTTIVQRAAARAGLPRPERFTGRSLRLGMILAAAAVGTPDEGIMAHTGHRSKRLVRAYPTRPLTPPPGFCDRTRADCAPCVAETGSLVAPHFVAGAQGPPVSTRRVHILISAPPDHRMSGTSQEETPVGVSPRRITRCMIRRVSP